MKFTVRPQTHPDGTPVLAQERITWLRSQADAMEKFGAERTAAKCREQATAAEEEARLAQEPRRWERRP